MTNEATQESIGQALYRRAMKLVQEERKREAANIFEAAGETAKKEMPAFLKKKLGVEDGDDIEGGDESEVEGGEQQELQETEADWRVKGWVEHYSDSQFEWLQGKHKGMTFFMGRRGHELTGRDPHVRGGYENHPEFNNIDSDIHQLSSLLDDIVSGKVKVTQRNKDITAKIKRDAEQLQNHLENPEADEEIEEDTETPQKLTHPTKGYLRPDFTGGSIDLAVGTPLQSMGGNLMARNRYVNPMEMDGQDDSERELNKPGGKGQKKLTKAVDGYARPDYTGGVSKIAVGTPVEMKGGHLMAHGRYIRPADAENALDEGLMDWGRAVGRKLTNRKPKELSLADHLHAMNQQVNRTAKSPYNSGPSAATSITKPQPPRFQPKASDIARLNSKADAARLHRKADALLAQKLKQSARGYTHPDFTGGSIMLPSGTSLKRVGDHLMANNRYVNPKEVQEASLNEATVDLHVKHWADQYGDVEFEWLSGRNKGMIFSMDSGGHQLAGRDPHVRGGYENHPEFGDIRNDAHQLAALLDDIISGKVKVTRDDKNITSSAKRDAERLQEYLEDDSETDLGEAKMPDFLKKKFAAKDASGPKTKKKGKGKLPDALAKYQFKKKD